MLHATVAIFGAEVSVVVAGTHDAVVVRVPGGYLALDSQGVATPCERPPDPPPPPTAPFTFEEFGTTHRLAWPGSGIRVKSAARTVYWDARFAAIVAPDSITVIDGIASAQARVNIALYTPFRGCLVHANRLWIGGDGRVGSIDLTELEQILAATDRNIALITRTVYPLHEADARVDARVAWVFESGAALVNVGTEQVRFPDLGLQHGTNIVLCERLYGTTFVAMEIPGRGRVPLSTRTPEATTTVAVVRGKSKDPAATGAPITASDPRVEALLVELARDPDDEGNRIVLVDLLQELGAQFGTWVAEGNITKARRKEALGPLAHFLDGVTWRSGLPWAATLVRRPPSDPALLEQAANDLRLGMLSTLRAGTGPKAVYTRLVGSPRATGLRRVDASEPEYAVAMIDGGRTQLTHLHDVRFARARLMKLLADATFDGVREIETIVQSQHVAGLVVRLQADEHGLFIGRTRRLIVRERHDHDSLLMRDLLGAFRALPVRDLTVGNLRVRRDDEGRVTVRVASASVPLAYWLEPLAAALPELAAIEVEPGGPRHALGQAFPAASIVTWDPHSSAT